MLKKIKDWFIGLKNKVVWFFAETVKEDIEVNFGGFMLLWILAALEVSHIVSDVMFKLIPLCLKVNFFVTAFVVLLLIGVLAASVVVDKIWAILNPRVREEWRVVS